jgi:hypothetical protein
MWFPYRKRREAQFVHDSRARLFRLGSGAYDQVRRASVGRRGRREAWP